MKAMRNWAGSAVLGMMLVGGGTALAAQDVAAAPHAPHAPKLHENAIPAPEAPALPADSGQSPGATQERLMELLHLSPSLADVLASDPSLLSDNQYVARTNPELAAFLTAHPEVTRNPGFYLFSKLREPNQKHYPVLEPKEGFQRFPELQPQSPASKIIGELFPLAAMAIVFGSLLWLVRLVLENRRWSRTFQTQSQAHWKLIDRFGANEELLRYMETDAGKRFLEAVPGSADTSSRLPNLVGRMLNNLQFGIVATLLGVGLLGVRHSVGESGAVALLVLGILVLMPGLGLILSAGVSWYVGRRMNLISAEAAEPHAANRQ